jgi:hypothetical protein
VKRLRAPKRRARRPEADDPHVLGKPLGTIRIEPIEPPIPTPIPESVRLPPPPSPDRAKGRRVAKRPKGRPGKVTR